MDLKYYKQPSKFVADYPKCTFAEFHLATGCEKQAWYDARYRQGKRSVSGKDFHRPNSKAAFIALNPNATYEEFEKQFPGAGMRSYHNARSNAKLVAKAAGKTVNLRSLKHGRKSAPKEKPKTFTSKPKQEDLMEEHYAKNNLIRGEVSMGITPDFIWYESTIIRNDFARTMSRFEHLVRVMEARQADNNKALEQVLSDYRKVREENKSLIAMLDAKTKPGA